MSHLSKLVFAVLVLSTVGAVCLVSAQVPPTIPMDSFIGQHFLYEMTYKILGKTTIYEFYIRNASFVDYRIWAGEFPGRYVKEFGVNMDPLAYNMLRASWVEASGVVVTETYNFTGGWSSAFIANPAWIRLCGGQKCGVFKGLQDEAQTAKIVQLRAIGPTYSTVNYTRGLGMLSAWAVFRWQEKCGANNDRIIDCEPGTPFCEFKDMNSMCGCGSISRKSCPTPWKPIPPFI